MEYELTQHARRVLSERQIEVVWMERVLVNPIVKQADAADPHLTHYLGPVTERDDAVLRVVVDGKARPPRVITAFFDRRMRGRI